MIYPVPDLFKVPDIFYYPEDNWPDFEYWFMMNAGNTFVDSDRTYLPILFTSYFKINGYGLNKKDISPLQDFVDTLPADIKYFTIVQYDDGTLIDWKGKDVAIFSMSSKPQGCIPIPLVCQPHVFKFPAVRKDILCSFIGRITDPIRKTIVDWGTGKGSCYITSRSHSLQNYCEVLARSRFVLCPRGYGASSFRIGEALQYGGEPIIFINPEDKPFERALPYTLHEGIVEESMLEEFYQYMLGRANDSDQFYTPERAYKDFYTFDAVKKRIFSLLWNLQ